MYSVTFTGGQYIVTIAQYSMTMRENPWLENKSQWRADISDLGGVTINDPEMPQLFYSVFVPWAEVLFWGPYSPQMQYYVEYRNVDLHGGATSVEEKPATLEEHEAYWEDKQWVDTLESSSRNIYDKLDGSKITVTSFKMK
jgi:hypothetical protein